MPVSGTVGMPRAGGRCPRATQNISVPSLGPSILGTVYSNLVDITEHIYLLYLHIASTTYRKPARVDSQAISILLIINIINLYSHAAEATLKVSLCLRDNTIINKEEKTYNRNLFPGSSGVTW